MDAFNDTMAAGSSYCQSMLSDLTIVAANEVATQKSHSPIDAAGISQWAFLATAAKACAIKVHAETSDSIPARVPHNVLVNACAYVKAHLTQANGLNGMVAANSSWACGWPSPVPNYRPIPNAL